jgi:transposase-like protein
MNLIDVTQEFATEDACLAYLEAMRWPTGVACLACGSVKVKRLKLSDKRGKTRRVYQCLERPCQHQFTATTGTIFHDTHLPLRTWFIAMALICDAKKGMSACQLQRHLPGSKKGQKMSYRTAWYLCHRIRKAMEEGPTGLMTGTIEVDETYIGGRYDRRRKRGPWEKQGVVGLIQRKGKVHVETIPTPSKQVLVGVIKDRVSPKADLVITDELAAYKSVGETHRHAVINHIREYVRGKIHTNSIENFWSLLKRGIMGSYHKVSIKHLPRYLAEFEYRFNRREEQEQMFVGTLKNLLNRGNLPYKALTASPVSES